MLKKIAFVTYPMKDVTARGRGLAREPFLASPQLMD
jgi:hypothetical protein